MSNSENASDEYEECVDQWDLYECQNCGDTYAGRSESAAQNYECFACGAPPGCFKQIDQDIYADGGEFIPQTPPDCGKCGAEEEGIHGVPIQVGGGVRDVNLCDDCLDEIQRGGDGGG